MDGETARVEIEGLPVLVVEGVIAPAEPEVGIFAEYVDEIRWEAAEGELTGEQEAIAEARVAEIEEAFLAVIAQRTRDAMDADADEEVWLRANNAA